LTGQDLETTVPTIDNLIVVCYRQKYVCLLTYLLKTYQRNSVQSSTDWTGVKCMQTLRQIT